MVSPNFTSQVLILYITMKKHFGSDGFFLFEILIYIFFFVLSKIFLFA